MEKHKIILLTSLFILMAAVIATGIYLKHYFVVSLFAAWLGAECLMWRLRELLAQPEMAASRRFRPISRLLHLYGRFDTVPEQVVADKMLDLKMANALKQAEERYLDRLKNLIELRGLTFGKAANGKKRLRQAFSYCTGNQSHLASGAPTDAHDELSLQDVTESAIHVADLYWKLFETAVGDYPDHTKAAKKLYFELFHLRAEDSQSKRFIEGLTDCMQRDGGIPFLVLNLIRKGNLDRARQIAQMLLQEPEKSAVDEDVRSVLYWMTEIHFFQKEGNRLITDFASSIRYLYHLCFLSPERAAFLEIDSQFFSQFETVNELAREGFLFRETLVEKTLLLWGSYEGYFDEVFQTVLEAITQKRNKIFDELTTWKSLWKREQEDFSRDYLHVVEGNLSYARGQIDEARSHYEKALKLNSDLRSAKLNLLFCYARTKLTELHEWWTQKLISDPDLLPAALYNAANSFILSGNEQKAEAYYAELKKQKGWEKKSEYYRSTFCFENGLYEQALHWARQAHHINPTDTTISYHLSLCYSAVGEKDQALDMVKQLGDSPEWLTYYRFTLERDSGRHHEASDTLMKIPKEYFQDPEELEAALDFARTQKNLVLLRHLRRHE